MANESKDNPARAAVKKYLDGRAAADPLFAAAYSNPDKSIDACWKFICSEAKKRAAKGTTCVCMSDAEVFGLAVHYYDEATEAGHIDSTPAEPAAPAPAPVPAPRKPRKRLPEPAGDPYAPMLFDPDEL